MTVAPPRPKYTPAQAADRCRALIGKGQYKLGALDSDATRQIFDCTSFCMRYAFGLPGHRPGFNHGWAVDWSTGMTATVVDDINSNSAIEDALHLGDLFEVVVGAPRVGDICAYPTIRIPTAGAGPWIGHAAIVDGVDRAKGKWDPVRPTFALLDIIECFGPDGRMPAIRGIAGKVFDDHSTTWPKPQHRSWLLRVKP